MEFLKDILGEELFKSVSAKVNEYNGANPDKAVKLANLSGGEYVSKDKYATLETEANGYKTQLETLVGEIDTLKKSSKGDSAALKSQLEALQTKYNDDTEALKKTIGDLKFNNALNTAIAASGAKSVKALKGVLDMDKIKFEDDKLSGFSEQLEAAKKEYGYLFNEEPSTGMRHGGAPADTDKMSDAEYYAHYYKNKEKR